MHLETKCRFDEIDKTLKEMVKDEVRGSVNQDKIRMRTAYIRKLLNKIKEFVR